jgi:hypothetical protein
MRQADSQEEHRSVELVMKGKETEERKETRRKKDE